ncbi:DUF2500 domain-containing protein [Photobacterium sp. MCCC 1A19761]
MPTPLILIVTGLLILSAFYALRIYRRHVQGDQAPEKTVQVEILDKQSIAIAGARPGEDSEAYWIYVRPLRGGPKREFEVGVHYYHALNPGDRGTMTYQGQTFRHFALQRD